MDFFRFFFSHMHMLVELARKRLVTADDDVKRGSARPCNLFTVVFRSVNTRLMYFVCAWDAVCCVRAPCSIFDASFICVGIFVRQLSNIIYTFIHKSSYFLRMLVAIEWFDMANGSGQSRREKDIHVCPFDNSNRVALISFSYILSAVLTLLRPCYIPFMR